MIDKVVPEPTLRVVGDEPPPSDRRDDQANGDPGDEPVDRDLHEQFDGDRRDQPGGTQARQAICQQADQADQAEPPVPKRAAATAISTAEPTSTGDCWYW